MTLNGKQIPDSVIDRIQKLMRLTTERGASEAEATLAAEHVQRLLSEFNLTLAHVEQSGGETAAEGKREKSAVNRRQVYKWQRELMQALGELNYCRVLLKWQYKGGSGPGIFDGYDLIGRAANVVSATAMFDYLLQAIERLAREDVNNDPTQFFTRYAHSFKEGAAHRIVERLQRKRDELERESEAKRREEEARRQHPAYSGSTLPVIVLADVRQNEEDLNNDYRWGWAPGTTARKRREDEAKWAARDAERAARKAELIAQGIDPEVADYMSYGYSEDRARELATPKVAKPETEKQREKRRRREERDREARQRRWEREAAKTDWEGYYKGQSAGDQVGLDPQVGKGDDRRRLK